MNDQLVDALASDMRRCIRSLDPIIAKLESGRWLSKLEKRTLAATLQCEREKLDDTLHVYGLSMEQWLSSLNLT